MMSNSGGLDAGKTNSFKEKSVKRMYLFNKRILEPKTLSFTNTKIQ